MRGFDGSELWKTLVRSLLGEVGDKTFLVTVALAAWCPWGGVRGGDHENWQMLGVFGGALLGLSIRDILLGTLPASSMSGWAFPSPWGWVFEAAACGVVALLAFRALIEARSNLPAAPLAEPAQKTQDAESVEDDPSPEEPKWNTQAFALPPKLAVEGATTYGTAPLAAPAPPGTLADGLFAERFSDPTLSTIIAPFLAAFLVFLVEAGDKSEAVLVSAGPRGAPSVLGAILGLVCTLPIAIFVGFIMERQMPPGLLLGLITALFLGLFVVSLSQALLALPALQPPAVAVA